MKKHAGMFSESYFTFSFPSLPNWNRAIFSADSCLLSDGSGIYGPHQPNRDPTGKHSRKETVKGKLSRCLSRRVWALEKGQRVQTLKAAGGSLLRLLLLSSILYPGRPSTRLLHQSPPSSATAGGEEEESRRRWGQIPGLTFRARSHRPPGLRTWPLINLKK